MITFRPDFGVYWPDYDHSPEKCFRFVRHGLSDMDVALGLCQRRRVCVQAGGHVGLWPLRLAGSFGAVYSFECEPVLFECLRRNTAGVANIVVSDCALGALVGDVHMRPSVSAGSWRIDPKGTVRVRQTTIDKLKLSACDALFLDIEGYEVEALRGAAETIRKFRPIVHVEELPRSRDAIREHLSELGYKWAASVHNDCVYVG